LARERCRCCSRFSVGFWSRIGSLLLLLIFFR
jgi:hypothetical protein